jgi:regulator of protease activity HflC (stomatin/prohibitin superfamily)
MGVTFTILGIIAVIILVFISSRGKVGEKRSLLNTFWLVPIIFFGLVFFSMLFIVPAGYRGVVLTFGKVDRVVTEGLNVKNPWWEEVVQMSVKTQLYEVPNAEAASKDLQDVRTSIGINFRLDPAEAGRVYQTIGVNYIDVIAKPAVQEVLKATTAKYAAEDLILRRESVKDDIASALSSRLGERGIITESVNITNFNFSAKFNEAIEAKMVAAQNVMEAETKLKRIEVEARQAQAQAIGEANAAIARAEGQAKANAILTQSLSDRYLRYMYIDKLAKDAKVIIVPEGMPLAIQP